MPSPREQHLVGLDYLEAVTDAAAASPQRSPDRRVVSKPPTCSGGGASRARPTTIAQLFWFRQIGRPRAAVIATDWGDRVALDPLVMPDESPDWVAMSSSVASLTPTSPGWSSVDLEVDRADDVLREVLARPRLRDRARRIGRDVAGGRRSAGDQPAARRLPVVQSPRHDATSAPPRSNGTIPTSRRAFARRRSTAPTSTSSCSTATTVSPRTVCSGTTP